MLWKSRNLFGGVRIWIEGYAVVSGKIRFARHRSYGDALMVSQLFSLSGFLRLPGLLLLATFALSVLQPQPFHPDRPAFRRLFGSEPKNASRPRALPKAPVDIPIDPVPVPEDAAAEPMIDTEPGSDENSRALQ